MIVPYFIKDVRTCLSLEDRHFGAWSGLGLTHMSCKQYAVAEKAFEKAIAINPWMRSTTVGVNLGVCRAAGQASES